VSQVQILPWAHFPDMQKPPLTSADSGQWRFEFYRVVPG
jgi:hypothetical protein